VLNRILHAARQLPAWLIFDVRQMKDEHRQALARIRGLTEGIRLLEQSGMSGAALVLTYSTIDILGSLLRPDSTQDAKRPDFQKWVTTFMLPRSTIGVSAIDLWAARCGLLHCLSPYSNLSRSGKAKEIAYASTPEMADTARAAAKADGLDVIVVLVSDFLKTFAIGAQRFAVAVDQDPEVERLFDMNYSSLFTVS
jgi:hypothetical protein